MKQLIFLVTAWLAATPANSIIYSAPELLRDVCHACMHESHIATVTSLGFTCDVNHVGMMSLGLTFHSYHVWLAWHNIIGVHIA